MEIVIFLPAEVYPNVHLPGFFGLTAWILAFFSLFALAARLRVYQSRPGSRQIPFLLACFVLAVLSSLYIGVRWPLEEPVPLQGLVGLQTHVYWMLLSAVPMFLAAGLSGPVASLFIALLTGLFSSIFQTHNPFTILEYGLFGLLAGYLIRQPYRTRFFRLAARPFGTALLLSLLFPLVEILSAFMWLDDPLGTDLDRIFQLLLPTWGGFASSVLLAAFVGEMVAVLFPRPWGGAKALRPSPSERSLAARTLSLVGVLTAVLVVLFSLLGWFGAYRSARELTRERMAGAAKLAADHVPTLLDIGQNLLLAHAQSADLRLSDDVLVAAELDRLLIENVFFSQFILLRPTGELVTGAARVSALPDSLTPAEDAGAQLSIAGVPFQYYTSALADTDTRSFVSFIAALPDRSGSLVGRMVLADSAFAEPLLGALNNLDDQGGAGILVDDTGLILYHPVAEMVGTDYQRAIPVNQELNEELSSDGTQVFVYGVPATGRAWTVVMETPVENVQQLAVRTAGPLVGLLLAFAFLTVVVLQVVLGVVTGSLRSLAFEANRIAEDTRVLRTPLRVSGVDEVGVMRTAFERMRASLSSRMEEQRQLLLASTGAAATLNFDAAVRPILSAALSTGAVSARIVLPEGALPGKEAGRLIVYGAGPAGASFAYLDAQILAISGENSPLILRQPLGNPGLNFPSGQLIPGSIVAVALHRENDTPGVLWIAYEGRRSVTGDQVRFLSTLGAQAVLAAANARLFLDAEIGRERLAAILTSTPDPVIVTDQEGRLLLANPAAWSVLNPALETGLGSPIEALLTEMELVDLLRGSENESRSIELALSDGQTYNVKATSVISGGRSVGRIGVLRDVTRFKELDKLKSQFVSNVSHDLKAPLVVIKGYARMLSMIGDLNSDQVDQVGKIMKSVDRMTKIVEDLVLLGQLESDVPLRLEAVFPRQMLGQLAENYRVLAEVKKIRLEVNYGEREDRLIEVDRMMIERALGNLVENAIKYTPEEGRVEMAAAFDDSGHHVVLSVQDNGVGISPAHQERLFERFYRVPHRESLKQPGSGLGLAIVRSAVERHDGKVLLESSVGKGSLFRLVIPIRSGRNRRG